MRPRLRDALAALAAALPLAALGPAGGCSCGDNLPHAGDGGAQARDGGLPHDGGIGSDAAAPLLWVDFSITGCAEAGGPGAPDAGPGGTPDAGADSDAGPATAPCQGRAPLELTFVPVSPAAIDIYSWTFGDGSAPDGRAAPDHVFAHPGTYDVALNAQGPGGTAAISKPGAVVVEPAAVGGGCTDGLDCASGDCVCGAGDGGCTGVAAGFCSAPCSNTSPCGEGVCADLAPTAPASPAPWQAQLCLPDCSSGQACPDGLVCRELPRGDGTGWVQACFAPGLVGDLGDSCADPSGSLDNARCTSGSCLALGVRGLCSAACSAVSCPPSAACATFAGGAPGPSCLARCSPSQLCDRDPVLACEPAGGTGPLSFTVDETPADAGYCAPKHCTTPGDCGTLGVCQNGFCSPP